MLSQIKEFEQKSQPKPCSNFKTISSKMINQINSELLEDLSKQQLLFEPDNILRALYFIQNDKKLIESAVDVLDNIQYIQKVFCKDRYFYIIPGSHGKDYLCIENYCSCPRYAEILKHPSQSKSLCKHLVATKVAFAFGKVKEKSLPNDEFVREMCRFN